MIFKSHSHLAGQHAFLSASKSSWVNYDDDKLAQAYYAQLAAQQGSELHDLAMRLIRLGVPLEDKAKTLNLYVNHAIGFRMHPEVVLFYDENAYGTCDCISFRDDFLRIHDLKTGKSPASWVQLLIYAALFCLEYKVKPTQIETELRIYQNDDFEIMATDPLDIVKVMDRIVTGSKLVRHIRLEELS